MKGSHAHTHTHTDSKINPENVIFWPPPNPLKIIYIDTQSIKKKCRENFEYFPMRLKFEKNQPYGRY